MFWDSYGTVSGTQNSFLAWDSFDVNKKVWGPQPIKMTWNVILHCQKAIANEPMNLKDIYEEIFLWSTLSFRTLY
jgi:hypothetical protein